VNKRSSKSSQTAAGDEPALLAHRAELQHFLARRLRHSQDATDLLQDVYVRFLQAPQRDLVRQPLAYLYRIASNLIRDFQARQQHGPVSYDSQAVDEITEHPADVWRDDLGDPMSARQTLEKTLGELPSIYQSVLLLRKRDGMSSAEIAKELGISKHTAEKYLYRAIAHFRAAHWE
jgi:RNA polymerase sigma factor (sigma-70 family)